MLTKNVHNLREKLQKNKFTGLLRGKGLVPLPKRKSLADVKSIETPNLGEKNE